MALQGRHLKEHRQIKLGILDLWKSASKPDFAVRASWSGQNLLFRLPFPLLQSAFDKH